MDIRITGKDYMEEMLRLQSRVKELETEVIRWKEEHKFQAAITRELLPYQERAIKAEARVRKLEGAINGHRDTVKSWHTDMFLEDEELYAVLEHNTSK